MTTFKTTGVTATDVIRVRNRTAGFLFRDRMTVGEFLDGVPDRHSGLELLARSQMAGAIGFVQGVRRRGPDGLFHFVPADEVDE
jgi:hypothetical protein